MKRWKLGKLGMVFAVAGLVFFGITAASFGQGPGDGPGIGPHRPPMERAMGPGGPGGPGGPRGEMGRWWNDPHAVEKLKLTETQRKAMDDIYQQHRLTLVDLHASLEKAELAMEPLMRADQPEENKILAQIDRVAQARAELEKANARMLLGMRKQLTPEQWKLMEAERAARREARGDGHGEGHNGLRNHRDWHGPSGAGGPGMKGPGTGAGAGPGMARLAPMDPEPEGPAAPAGPGEPGPSDQE